MHKSFMGWEKADKIIRDMFKSDYSDDEIAVRVGIPEGSIRHRRYFLNLKKRPGNSSNPFKYRVINMHAKGMNNVQIANILKVHVGQVSLITGQIGLVVPGGMVEEVRIENGIRIEKIKPAHAYGSESPYNRVYL